MANIINTVEGLKTLADKIKSASQPIALDTETNGLFFGDDIVVGFSVAFSETEGYYIPTNHKNAVNIPGRLVSQLFQLLSRQKLVYHNAKFDISMIRANYGIELPVYGDTQAMAYLLSLPKIALKEIIADFYGYNTVEFKELLASKFGKNWKKDGKNAADLNPEDIAEYAINDVLYTYKLFNRFNTEIIPYKTVYKLELNLIPIVAKMNMQGITIDPTKLLPAAKATKALVDKLGDLMTQMAWPGFKHNSPRDVPKVLYEQLGLPVLKRSRKTGAPSSDADVLEQLATMHVFPKYLMEYRSLNKFLSGYLEKIPALLTKDNKMYAGFNSLGAESGRFTCPGTENHLGEDKTINLQNQPDVKRVEIEGFEEFEPIDVRAAYVAPPGWTWVKADFSQIEYRVMSNLSGETNAITKFKSGMDFHTATARLMLGIPDEQELTKDQRQLGKTLNFGISYGMAVETVAKMINRSVAEAQQLYNDYFAALPRLQGFIKWAASQATENKEVRTLFGRRRVLDWTGLPPRVRDDMIKKGFNTIVQGTAADFLKIAMLRVKTRVLDKYGEDRVQLLLTVHDELDFIVRDDVLQDAMRDIKQAMEIPVPDEWCALVCDVEYGPSWSEKTHVDYEPTPEQYQPDKFEGWDKILPEFYSVPLDNPEYSAKW